MRALAQKAEIVQPPAPCRPGARRQRTEEDAGQPAAAPIADGPPLQYDFSRIPVHPAPLRIGSAGDPLEQEAERVADQVVGPAHLAQLNPGSRDLTIVRRQCSCGGGCDQCQSGEEQEEEPPAALRMKRMNSGDVGESVAPQSVHDVLQSPGQALDGATRAFMEASFRRDFSAVRVHCDSPAQRSAQEIRAAAWTAGQHVVFSPGRFAPETTEGLRLIAHELTHVVQQSQPAAIPASTQVRRAPLQDFPTPLPKTPFDRQRFGRQLDPDPLQDPDQLYFTERYLPDEPCRSCHRPDEKVRTLRRSPSNTLRNVAVTRSNLTAWAISETWKAITPNKAFRLLQRHEDDALTALFEAQLNQRRQAVLESGDFVGADRRRREWADFLDLQHPDLVKELHQQAEDGLVNQIRSALLSGVIPSGASLVTQPESVKAIAETPERESIRTGLYDDVATVGFEWVGKRIKSVSPYDALVFEVIGYEGIYFELSGVDFRKTQPGIAKVAANVTEATKGIALAGSFIKGFLTALASPVFLVADTAAKVIDMGSLALAAGVKWASGREIGFTCLSSTCQTYQACLTTEGKSPVECQTDAMKEALENASVIIPIFRQGADCVAGDVEACGGIAALAVGLVAERAGKLGKRDFEAPSSRTSGKVLSKEEFQRGAIREAIGRPHAEDVPVGKALEKTREAEEAPRAQKRKASATEANLEKIHQKQVKEFAAGNKIKPKQLEAELTALDEYAADPAKVREPSDRRYDAEISTSVNGEPHTYERTKGVDIWCRFSGEGKCGVPVRHTLDAKVNETMRRRKGKAAPAAIEEAPAEPAPRDRRAAIAERARAAERANSARAREARESARQTDVARTEKQIERERSAILRINKELSELDKKSLKGPTKEAKRRELTQEAERRGDRVRSLQATLGTLEADPLVKLRAYSYSAEAERFVLSRDQGVDAYSKLEGGPGKKVRSPSIDHLNPVDEIATLSGFWELFEDGQKEILSKTYNLNLMEKSLNSSKGNRVRLADWKEGRIAYGERGIAEMERIKSEARARLQSDIAALPKKTGAKTRQASASPTR